MAGLDKLYSLCGVAVGPFTGEKKGGFDLMGFQGSHQCGELGIVPGCVEGKGNLVVGSFYTGDGKFQAGDVGAHRDFTGEVAEDACH